ncbi:MAG: hypothetical protein IKK49_07460 [Clostridia bacterium]|nr:hypothetical protein [Clostridia bacterium]
MANIAFETAATFVSGVLKNSAYLSILADKLAQGNSIYLKTLGFYVEGDGGGACYKVIGPVSSNTPISFDSTTALFYADGCFGIGNSETTSNNPIAFRILPQDNSIKAEQFGVLSIEETALDFLTRIEYNSQMLNLAINYAATNGKKLTFSKRKKIFLGTKNSLNLRNKIYIDGNGAELQIYYESNSNKEKGLFVSEGQDKPSLEDIYVKNLKLIGRRISATEGFDDQAFHINAKNFTAENVSISQFEYGYHNFGASISKNYELPPITSENWLIKNCRIKNTTTGLHTNEINGIIIKNTDIFGYYTQKYDHSLYWGSNCSNIRVSASRLGYNNGGAVHKNYSRGSKAYKKYDASRNQFYTDLLIHNVETCWMFGMISENTMCDSNLATCVNRILVNEGSVNCIISNCDISQTRDDSNLYQASPDPSFVTIEDASRFWMQNSKIHHKGLINKNGFGSDLYYWNICSTSPEKRAFLGANNDIANIVLKFSGCTIENLRQETTNYIAITTDKPLKVEEYWDNCLYSYDTISSLWKLYCINNIPSGICVRNSSIINRQEIAFNTINAPFVYQCSAGNCSCLTEAGCQLSKTTVLPWLHLENVLLDNAFFPNTENEWNYIINTANETQTTISDAVNISNSYVFNCYKVLDNIRTPINNLMRIK